MRYRIFSRKISFLFKLLHPQRGSISSDVFNALKDHEPGPLIVQQCRFLEQIYGTNLTSSSDISLRSIKKTLRKADQNYIWDQAANHNSLSLMSRDISWPRLWDTARDHGPQAALSLQAVLRMLTSPTYKESSCSHCNFTVQNDSPPADHLYSHLSYSLDILTLLMEADETIFLVGSELRTSDLHSILLL